MINTIINFLYSSSDTIYWISATVGTTFFLLRMALSFFGGGFFEDAIDVDDAAYDGEHHDGALFKFLTMHSLSGFLMMFGWSGLACIHQFFLPSGSTAVIALGCGFVMLLVTVSIMRAARFFEAHGSVFSAEKTVGLKGMVYQSIPAHGQGKIHIVVDSSTRELLAQSHTKKAIEPFALVKVVKALDHEIVEVIELSEELL